MDGHPGTVSDWPRLVLSLLEGQEPLPDRLVAGARAVTGADGAGLVRWVGGRPRVLRGEAAFEPVPELRPPEGASIIGDRPALAVPFGPDASLIAVRDPAGKPFRDEDAEALRAVAEVAASGTGSPREALAALYELATKIIGTLDLDEVLLTVANAAARLLRAEIAGVFLLNHASGVMEMRCTVGHRTVGTARLRVRPGQGLAGKVLETGRTEKVDEYVTDTGISKDFLTIAKQEGTRSALCAPMQVQGRTEGVLCVWRRRRSFFAEDEVRLMTALADLAAVAVERASLSEARRESAEKLARAHGELERRYAAAERAIAIHNQLTEIAVEGGDLAAAVGAVRALASGWAALVADDATVLAEAPLGAGAELVGRLRPHLEEVTLGGSRSRVLPAGEHDQWLVVAPVRAAGARFGHLCLYRDQEPGPEDVVAVEQAGTVCALLLAREEAAVAAARRLQSEFIWDLLEGRIPDEAEALVRARHLGHAFELPARLVVMAAEGLERHSHAEGWPAERLERARVRVGQALWSRMAAAVGTRLVSARRADLFASLVPLWAAESPDQARKLGLAAIGDPVDPAVRVAVGVSGVVHGVAEFPEAYRQAQFALSAASGSPEGVAVFDDLGVLQFLMAPADRRDLDGFAERVLGPLLEYDRAHRGELVRTLEAYLEADCNLQRSAELLYVHHKTMRYRLQRVQDLTGLSLQRQEDRFTAQLALKILRLS